jgi:hypothetical protein
MQETRRQQLTEQFVALVEQINQCMHSRSLEKWPDLEQFWGIGRMKILELAERLSTKELETVL